MYNTIIEHLISKAIKDFLLEGRNEEKAKQKTYEIIKQHFDNAAWLINVVDNNVLNPNHLTVVEYIESTFRRDYFGTNVSDSVIRLEPIMMNIALQLGFEQNNSDDEKLKRLQDIITYIKNNYKKEGFPIPLNKLTLENSTYDYLNQIFGNAIDKEIEYDNQISNRYSKNKSINSKYQIIEIHSQKEAYRLLNYDGLMYIAEPTKSYDETQRNELINLLKRNGFTIVGNIEDRGKFFYLTVIKK